MAYGGQGGLGDIALHPDFAKNQWVYLSYAEQGQGGYGAVVVRGKLDLTKSTPQLTQIKNLDPGTEIFFRKGSLWAPDYLWLR